MAIANITNNILTDSGTLLSSLQPTITLTTTGTSGAATLISNTLNIPQYTSGGGTGTSGTSGTSGLTGTSGTSGVSGGGASLAIGSTITSATAGSILYAGALGVLAQDNANFFYDYTNTRLLVGTTTTTDARVVAVGNNANHALFVSSPVLYAGVYRLMRMYTNGNIVLDVSSTSGTDLSFNNQQNGFISFSTNNTQRLLISSGGSIGVGTSTIGSTLQVNGNAAIGYSASTAGPTNGLQVAGNIYSAGTGSTTTTPREVGISNFAATNAARFTFGDSANCIQNANGGMMQIVSYHAMQIYGGRLGTAVNFITSVPTTDPSLNIIGSVTTRPTLVVTPVVSQTANTQEWRNSSGTALSVVTPSGTFGLLTTTIGSTLQVNGNAAIGYSASTAAPTNGLAVSGNVGIGTTTPTTYTGFTTLAINGTTGGVLDLLVNGTLKGQVSMDVSNFTFQAVGASTGIVFVANAAIRLAITSSGAATFTTGANSTAITSTGYSLTGANAQSLLDLAGTWNTTGNPTAIKLNITNTASGAAADLMELQVGSVTQFKVDKVGIVTANTIVKSGGTGAQYLMADGTVTTSTGTGTSGTSGTTGTSGVNGANGTGAPVGANTQIQFYDVSTFGGSPNLTWDKTINKLSVTGDVNITGVLSQYVVTNRQTASYTLALSDNGKLVEMNVATANNLTVPLNSSISFPIGTEINIVQYGAGQTTVVATGGVTIRSTNSWLKLNSQYGAATLIKIGTDEWYLFGNINA